MYMSKRISSTTKSRIPRAWQANCNAMFPNRCTVYDIKLPYTYKQDYVRPNSNSTNNKLPWQPNKYKGFQIFGVMFTVGFAMKFMV